ncbi:uncharacterized protein LOC129795644 [Lutzomyia longipalpis]|uniref:uncharacterized protein LOC129795644 n=1 Tax=Lutzomyia longipalpis TaxID=7200 RepID=UPI0024832EE2|nr:uncharacterized protein LOC129795644 [Lutzomyia longipalpis]
MSKKSQENTKYVKVKVLNWQPNSLQQAQPVPPLQRAAQPIPPLQRTSPQLVPLLQRVRPILPKPSPQPAQPVEPQKNVQQTPAQIRQMEIVDRTIKEMKLHDILWNRDNPSFNTLKRTNQLEESAIDVGITVEKLTTLIEYIKRQHQATWQLLQQMKCESRSLTPIWKWYNACSFLLEPKKYSKTAASGKKVPKGAKISKSPKQGCSKEITLNVKQDDSDEGMQLRSRSGLSQMEYSESLLDPLESKTEIVIVDPTNIKIEDPLDVDLEDPISVRTHTKPTKSSEGIKNRMTFKAESRIKRNVLIKAICSSVAFYLSNADLTEDHLVSFHSELIKYMHTYFGAKRLNK